MSKVEEFKKKGERTTYRRTGEHYEVSSTYGLGERMNKDPFDILMGDIDELMNKPRRFFDTMLTVVEHQRDIDPMIDKGNHRQYWDYLIKGCEMWLSAVENGVYGEVIKYAVPLTKEGRELKKEYEDD